MRQRQTNAQFRSNVLLVGLVLIFIFLKEASSFLTPRSSWRLNGKNVGGFGGSNGPPRALNENSRGFPGDGDSDRHNVIGLIPADDEDTKAGEGNPLEARGGSTKNKPDLEKRSGSKDTMSRTTEYWSRAWVSTTQTLTKPFRFVTSNAANLFSRKTKQQRMQEALMAELQSMPVKAVKVPNSTVLPPEVVSNAAKQSGIIGQPLRPLGVQQIAESINQWYKRKGYVLHSVTGANLNADDATAEIVVDEPVVSHAPVGIVYCKEMVVDEETGNLLTFRQYKERHTKRKTLGHGQISKQTLNTTFVTTTGRTNPRRIARALQLFPGHPFKWDSHKWQSIVSSGIFGNVLRATTQRTRDGSVQFQVVATERPPRNLEYGVSKSLYTGTWEGEIDFENANLFGGGEVVGLSVRRGTRDAEPSVRLSFNDNKFGQPGGYGIEAYSDFIGEVKKEKEKNKGKKEEIPGANSDALLSCKGATVRLQNPIDQSIVHHSIASVSVERTSTRAGHNENLGSATVGIGPFRKYLPFDARSSLTASVTTGARLPEAARADSESSEDAPSFVVLPYTSCTATTRQVFPLASDQTKRPIALALSHTALASTSNMPRHEANSAGIAAHVRGYDSSSNGPITSSLKGTTEIRIPITLPTDRFGQDASVVVFGEWLFARGYHRGDTILRKSSVGVGVRKTVQGIPIKYDLSYNKDGKISTFFGMGRDFDA